MGSAYVRFREEGDPQYLGVALEGVNVLSKLLFSWVGPLMDKGVQGEYTQENFDLIKTIMVFKVNSKVQTTFMTFLCP